MQVTMDVALEPLAYTVWVKWNVGQDKLIHKHTDTMDLLEPSKIIVIIPEDIVVAAN
jgi:hypothetical protein